MHKCILSSASRTRDAKTIEAEIRRRQDVAIDAAANAKGLRSFLRLLPSLFFFTHTSIGLQVMVKCLLLRRQVVRDAHTRTCVTKGTAILVPRGYHRVRNGDARLANMCVWGSEDCEYGGEGLSIDRRGESPSLK